MNTLKSFARGDGAHCGLTDWYPRGELDSPPGDYYHEWGWQNECQIPEKTKKLFEEWIYSPESYEENASLSEGSHTIKPW